MGTKLKLKPSLVTTLQLTVRQRVIVMASALTLITGIGILISINTGSTIQSKAEIPFMDYTFNGNTSNEWAVAANWDNGHVPVNGSNVFIPAGKTCNCGNIDIICLDLLVNGTLNVNSATKSLTTSGKLAGNGIITSTGTINLSGGGTFGGTITNKNTLTISGGFTMNGTLDNSATLNISGGLVFGSTGVYKHNRDGGTIPKAKWSTPSTCLITGITGVNGIGSLLGLDQTFGNLTWNCPKQSEEIGTLGPLTIAGTLSIENTGTQNFIFEEGVSTVANLSQTGGYVILASSHKANRTLDVKGDFKMSGGTFDFCNYKGHGLNVNATLNIAGNFTLSGGEIKSSDKGVSTIDITGDLLIKGGILDLTDFAVDKALSVAGNYVITCGKFIQNKAMVTLDGLGKQLVGGSSKITFNNLIINNTSGNQTVTLITDVTINGILTFSNGIIDALSYYSTTPLLKFSSTGSTGTTLPSDASHVIGPVMKVSDSKNSFVFPVGNLSYCRPISIIPSNNHTTTWTAQYFNSIPPNNTSLLADVNHISSTEYWTLNRATGGKPANAKIRLSWNSHGGVSVPSDMVVAYNTGAAWQSCANGGSFSSGGDANGGWVQTTNAWKSFGTFALGSRTHHNTLPVEMISFDATYSNPSIILNWETASEKNSDYFSIERSADGGTYTSIGTQKGAGNSTVTINYKFTDTNPIAGVNYYRLKQFDLDGKFEYSGVIAVNVLLSGNGIGSLTSGPNPFTDDINIYYTSTTDETIEIYLYDIYGRVVKKQQAEVSSGSNTFLMEDTQTLSSGIYMLGVVSNNKMTPLIKMVKNN